MTSRQTRSSTKQEEALPQVEDLPRLHLRTKRPAESQRQAAPSNRGGRAPAQTKSSKRKGGSTNQKFDVVATEQTESDSSLSSAEEDEIPIAKLIHPQETEERPAQLSDEPTSGSVVPVSPLQSGFVTPVRSRTPSSTHESQRALSHSPVGRPTKVRRLEELRAGSKPQAPPKHSIPSVTDTNSSRMNAFLEALKNPEASRSCLPPLHTLEEEMTRFLSVDAMLGEGSPHEWFSEETLLFSPDYYGIFDPEADVITRGEVGEDEVLYAFFGPTVPLIWFFRGPPPKTGLTTLADHRIRIIDSNTKGLYPIPLGETVAKHSTFLIFLARYAHKKEVVANSAITFDMPPEGIPLVDWPAIKSYIDYWGEPTSSEVAAARWEWLVAECTELRCEVVNNLKSESYTLMRRPRFETKHHASNRSEIHYDRFRVFCALHIPSFIRSIAHSAKWPFNFFEDEFSYLCSPSPEPAALPPPPPPPQQQQQQQQHQQEVESNDAEAQNSSQSDHTFPIHSIDDDMPSSAEVGIAGSATSSDGQGDMSRHVFGPSVRDLEGAEASGVAASSTGSSGPGLVTSASIPDVVSESAEALGGEDEVPEVPRDQTNNELFAWTPASLGPIADGAGAQGAGSSGGNHTIEWVTQAQEHGRAIWEHIHAFAIKGRMNVETARKHIFLDAPFSAQDSKIHNIHRKVYSAEHAKSIKAEGKNFTTEWKIAYNAFKEKEDADPDWYKQETQRMTDKYLELVITEKSDFTRVTNVFDDIGKMVKHITYLHPDVSVAMNAAYIGDDAATKSKPSMWFFSKGAKDSFTAISRSGNVDPDVVMRQIHNGSRAEYLTNFYPPSADNEASGPSDSSQLPPAPNLDLNWLGSATFYGLRPISRIVINFNNKPAASRQPLPKSRKDSQFTKRVFGDDYFTFLNNIPVIPGQTSDIATASKKNWNLKELVARGATLYNIPPIFDSRTSKFLGALNQEPKAMEGVLKNEWTIAHKSLIMHTFEPCMGLALWPEHMRENGLDLTSQEVLQMPVLLMHAPDGQEPLVVKYVDDIVNPLKNELVPPLPKPIKHGARMRHLQLESRPSSIGSSFPNVELDDTKLYHFTEDNDTMDDSKDRSKGRGKGKGKAKAHSNLLGSRSALPGPSSTADNGSGEQRRAHPNIALPQFAIQGSGVGYASGQTGGGQLRSRAPSVASNDSTFGTSHQNAPFAFRPQPQQNNVTNLDVTMTSPQLAPLQAPGAPFASQNNGDLSYLGGNSQQSPLLTMSGPDDFQMSAYNQANMNPRARQSPNPTGTHLFSAGQGNYGDNNAPIMEPQPNSFGAMNVNAIGKGRPPSTNQFRAGSSNAMHCGTDMNAQRVPQAQPQLDPDMVERVLRMQEEVDLFKQQLMMPQSTGTINSVPQSSHNSSGFRGSYGNVGHSYSSSQLQTISELPDAGGRATTEEYSGAPNQVGDQGSKGCFLQQQWRST